jgi:hypothetical protein
VSFAVIEDEDENENEDDFKPAARNSFRNLCEFAAMNG